MLVSLAYQTLSTQFFSFQAKAVIDGTSRIHHCRGGKLMRRGEISLPSLSIPLQITYFNISQLIMCSFLLEVYPIIRTPLTYLFPQLGTSKSLVSWLILILIACHHLHTFSE